MPRALVEEGRESRASEDHAAPMSLRPALAQPNHAARLPGAAWSIHDRTHLQCSLLYRSRLAALGANPERVEWEVYFFVPESFRLDSQTYKQENIYTDLKSYVRLASRDLPISALLGEPLARLRQALTGTPEEAMASMRLVACLVRDTFASTERQLAPQLSALKLPTDSARTAGDPEAQNRQSLPYGVPSLARPGAPQETRTSSLAFPPGLALEIMQVASTGTRLLEELTGALSAPKFTDPVHTAREWVKAEIALGVEAFFGRLTRRLASVKAPEVLLNATTEAALSAATAREHAAPDLVLGASLRPDQVEHFEFQRHVLKRFTSSVMWLKTKVTEPGKWVRHALFAFAASLAMAFAVGVALWNGMTPTDQLTPWLFAVVVAYAVKDRIKAILQEALSSAVSRHFADRRWKILDQAGNSLARVDEQSGFVPFSELAPEVLAARRRTRLHVIEEVARPETVLHHKKTFDLDAKQLEALGPDFDGLAEIFRLDLQRWLAHTDDPKQTVVVADTSSRSIRSYKAPRVYNIAVVYRLRYADEETSWHRLRVVVSRKGLKRLDHID